MVMAGVVMVGDAVTDVQSGLAAGCDAIFVRSGRGNAQESLLNGEACAIFEDLPAVVDALLTDNRYQKVRQST